jgi:hypothetical protein
MRLRNPVDNKTGPYVASKAQILLNHERPLPGASRTREAALLRPLSIRLSPHYADSAMSGYAKSAAPLISMEDNSNAGNYAEAVIAFLFARAADPASSLSGRKKKSPIRPPVSATAPQIRKPLLYPSAAEVAPSTTLPIR